jgi:hypothetical protein
MSLKRMNLVMSKSKNTKIPASNIAKRALEEAKIRQDKQELKAKEIAKEIGGTKGLEPTRYGDWEKKGITSDF